MLLLFASRKDVIMNWKTIGMGLLVAGLAVGCSSSKSARYNKDNTRYAAYDSNWNALHKGMTESQVANRLGNPRQERRFRNGAETWFYRDGGEVRFNSKGRVASWREPSYAGVRTYRTYSRNYERDYVYY
jgi:outer membrane protein assembly factor BamE (lipoprotein component of BamABCDE complex)